MGSQEKWYTSQCEDDGSMVRMGRGRNSDSGYRKADTGSWSVVS